MIEREKTLLAEKLEKDLQNAEVKMKIARSAEMNKARIEKMRDTHKLVDSLLVDAKAEMHEVMKKDPSSYKTLLKGLLVQGLIKMIEPTVWLRVRESDQSVINDVIPEAIAEYKK